MRKLSPNIRMLSRRLVYSFLHAIFLFVLCWWWTNILYTLDLEKAIVEKSIALKRALLKPKAPDLQSFAFIDISGIKKLVPREYRTGVDVITDRRKLASFFRIVNQVGKGQYQYLVCDVLFDKQTADDSVLAQELNECTKLVVPASANDKGLILPVFRVPIGYVGYYTSSGVSSTSTLVKFQAISECGMRSLPAVLHEAITQEAIERYAGIDWINGRPAINTLILDPRIRMEQLTDKDRNTKIIDFEELVSLLETNPELFFEKFLKNKIIILGDFVNDLHDTSLGSMPGPLILANIFLSLNRGDSIVTRSVFLYILVGLTIISWLILYPPRWMVRFHEWCERVPVGLFLGELFIFSFLVWLFSFLLYLFTNFHLDVVSVSLYITALSTVRFYVQQQKSAKLNRV